MGMTTMIDNEEYAAFKHLRDETHPQVVAELARLQKTNLELTTTCHSQIAQLGVANMVVNEFKKKCGLQEELIVKLSTKAAGTPIDLQALFEMWNAFVRNNGKMPATKDSRADVEAKLPTTQRQFQEHIIMEQRQLIAKLQADNERLQAQLGPLEK